jgi:hypothetical protein
MYLYQNSSKKLKKTISVLNPIGYLIGDLVGIGGGVLTALYLRTTSINSFLASLICILAAGAVAAVPVIYVWVRGLIWWNISEASKKNNADCENQDV